MLINSHVTEFDTLQVQHVHFRLVFFLWAVVKLAAEAGGVHKRSSEGITCFMWTDLKPGVCCVCRQTTKSYKSWHEHNNSFSFFHTHQHRPFPSSLPVYVCQSVYMYVCIQTFILPLIVIIQWDFCLLHTEIWSALNTKHAYNKCWFHLVNRS